MKTLFRWLALAAVVSFALGVAIPAQAGVLAPMLTLACEDNTLIVRWDAIFVLPGDTITVTVDGKVESSGVLAGTVEVGGTGLMTATLTVIGEFGAFSTTATRVCDPPGCFFDDGRVVRNECYTPAVPFCLEEGLQVYVPTETGEGELLFALSHEMIAAIGVPEGENVTLARQGDTILSRLTTGEFQLNAFDGEGNPFVLVWDGCPVTNVYQIKP